MEQKNAAERLQWHPAFSSALQIELAEDREELQISTEYPLTRKPLVMDVLIIKKKGDYKCKNPIAGFFRKHNIIEYKNPLESYGINDLCRTLAYAGIYQSNTEEEGLIDPEDITITVVCGRYPRKVMRWLKTICGVIFRLCEPGIYRAEPDRYFPIQFVINPQLDPEQYKWLSRLRSNLTHEKDVAILTKEYKGREHSPLYETAMDVIMRANKEVFEEAKNMCQALRELFADELRELDELREFQQEMEQRRKQDIEQSIERGVEQGIASVITNMHQNGFTLQQIFMATGKDIDAVKEILNKSAAS